MLPISFIRRQQITVFDIYLTLGSFLHCINFQINASKKSKRNKQIAQVAANIG